mgnify:CR=1 FL=1
MADNALDPVLDRLFRSARTPAGYADRPLPPGMLEQLWELVRLPPTAFKAKTSSP